MPGDDLATRHLLLRLRPIHRALRAAVERQARMAARLDRPDLVNLCVTDQHAAVLLDEIDGLLTQDPVTPDRNGGAFALTPEESLDEQNLREESAQAVQSLPLDVFVERLSLTSFETDCLLVCAATELDRAYERVIAYILDDLNRRFPCVELLAGFGDITIEERLQRHQVLGRYGRLRQCGLMEAFGEFTTERLTALRLGRGVFEFLLGTDTEVAGIWRVEPDRNSDIPTHGLAAAETTKSQRLGQALANGDLSVVGVWCADSQLAEAAVRQITSLSDRPLTTLRWQRVQDEGRESGLTLRDEFLRAAATRAILMLNVDGLCDPQSRRLRDELEELLSVCKLPTVLLGKEPWRPTRVLSTRSYAELELPVSNFATWREIWSTALPEANETRTTELAYRFRMSREEAGAVARVARTNAALETNGRVVTVDETLEAACAMVAQRSTNRLLTVVRPRRGLSDLILPDELHQQILEITKFTRALPQVAESWGFGRLATGGMGLKVLFTGEPGTGKTLAAEVIAGMLQTPLLKINIGQMVSKWVGETEKNLDEAFEIGTANRAVLFFDEADALFGKRGEVRHGVDRYANTEISHLLQRLEDHDGLVILASNLKDHIDPAFMRRFQVVSHFPRPSEHERRRLWQLAFPPSAPLEGRVDLDALATLDMTGASIMGAARTAALLATERGGQQILMKHIIHGVSRQYRRESRLLSSGELGAFAALLQEPL